MKPSKGKTPTIGLLSSSLYDSYKNAIWAGILDQASLQGARMLCFAGGVLNYPDVTHIFRNRLYELISEQSVDALILMSGCLGIETKTDDLTQFIKQHTGIPAVSIGINIPNVMSIIMDNETGMQKLVSHLIEEHGCRKIAFIKGTEANDEANIRLEAYKQTLAKYDIPFDPELQYPGEFNEEAGPRAVHYFVDEKNITFDALIGVDDRSILYAIDPLKKRGLRIPEDVKVAGFDDIIESQSSSPPLTTVKQPLFEIGSKAVKRACELIRGEITPYVEEIPTSLMIRNSCGCSQQDRVTVFSKREKTGTFKVGSGERILESLQKELEYTFPLYLPQSNSGDLPEKLETLVNVIMTSLKTPSAEEGLRKAIEDLVSSFFQKGLTVTLWEKIISFLFEKLSAFTSSEKQHTLLQSLWYKSIVILYQVESYLQTRERINTKRITEKLQEIGDKLTTSFDLNEIRSILTGYLPMLGINECAFSIFAEDRTQSQLVFYMGEKGLSEKEGTLYTTQELIPGGLPFERDRSYCIKPLVSESDQFGFLLFEVSSPSGYIYDTLAEKITTALNGVKLVEKIKQQNLELRKSKENLRITLDAIGDAVIAADQIGNVTRMNPVAEQLTGWSAGEALGRPLMDIYHVIDSETGSPVENPVDRVIREGQVMNLERNRILIAKDGTERIITDSGAPIRSAEDILVGIVLVFRDVTEQLKIEEQLRQAQKMDSIGQLAGGVAHDFNNMLAGISGAAEIIAFKKGKDESIARFIDMILKTTENAAELNNKLLAFSRKGTIRTKPVNIHTCLIDAVKILEHSIDRRVNITLELKADILTVIGDRSHLQNIFLNLALNARDAMPRGGELTLATSNVDLHDDYCSRSQFDIDPGSFIEISVHDTGIGMSKETRERIFEPFFTTKEVGKGTGLGLAAMYGIVSDHHGAIQVTSKLGKGTVFKVYLPVDESVAVPEKSGEEKIQTGSGCILVVDDEIIIRETLEEVLTNLGYTVLLAINGEEGMEIFKKKHETIDLVILDMVMPKMSGYDTFKSMMEIDPDSKILLSSGFSRDADMKELQQEGALGFIQKPYNYVKLSQLLVKFIQSSEINIA